MQAAKQHPGRRDVAGRDGARLRPRTTSRRNDGPPRRSVERFSSFTSLAAFKTAQPTQETHGLQGNPAVRCVGRGPRQRPLLRPSGRRVQRGRLSPDRWLCRPSIARTPMPRTRRRSTSRVTRGSMIPQRRTPAPAPAPMTTAGRIRVRPMSSADWPDTRLRADHVADPTRLCGGMRDMESRMPSGSRSHGPAARAAGPDSQAPRRRWLTPFVGGRGAFGYAGPSPAPAPRGALDGARGAMRASDPTVGCDEQVR